MLSIGGRVNVGKQVRGSQSLHFFLHTITHALEHRAATRKHNVLEQVSPDVFLALDDSLICVLMDSILTFLHLLAPQTRVEKYFGAL